jgi:hypothetical protein
MLLRPHRCSPSPLNPEAGKSCHPARPADFWVKLSVAYPRLKISRFKHKFGYASVLILPDHAARP